jgi:hypothetical protein
MHCTLDLPIKELVEFSSICGVCLTLSKISASLGDGTLHSRFLIFEEPHE